MIEASCYVCGSKDKAEIVRQEFRDGYLALVDESLNEVPRAIVACRRCGFVFHDPTLTDSEIMVMYEKYRDVDFRGETPDAYFDRITSLPIEESLNYRKTMEMNALLPEHLPNKKRRAIYDVGAGGGVFLNTFLEYADGEWEGYGVEPTPSYAELAGRRLGIPVKSGMYEPGLFDRTFDFITLIKVLEHVPDPIGFLMDLRSDLEDDGILYVEVPNALEIESLPSDHDQLQYTHLFFYSTPIFEYFFRRAGFEAVLIRVDQNPEGDCDTIAYLKKTFPDESIPDYPIVPYETMLMLGNSSSSLK